MFFFPRCVFFSVLTIDKQYLSAYSSNQHWQSQAKLVLVSIMNQIYSRTVCISGTYRARPGEGQFPPGLEDLDWCCYCQRTCVNRATLENVLSKRSISLNEKRWQFVFWIGLFDFRTNDNILWVNLNNLFLKCSVYFFWYVTDIH